MDADQLALEYQPVGNNGTVKITAKLGDHLLAAEKLDVLKLKDRKAFTERLCEDRHGIDRAAVDTELLQIAEQVTDHGSAQPSITTDEEIDTSRIVRPERLITTEVSGLAVPTVSERGGKPTGRWQLYLRWADSRRECVEVSTALTLPDGGRLWIHPVPAEPTPHEAQSLCGWSAPARRRWLENGHRPDPADLFKRICEQIAYFVDFPAEHAPGITATLGLWVIHTYVYPAWDAVPYLYIGGPMGSGKSRVFELLARLVFRSLSSSNLTAPALFRTLHQRGGTLLFDEAERLKQANDPAVGEIKSMLLAGYKRGGQATRLEPVDDTYRTVAFDVFGPKALACIVGLPPALASRCIPIMMFRAAPDSPKPRRRIDAEPQLWQAIRDDLHAMALDHGRDWLVLSQRHDVCPAMHGRDFELWQPLLALAAWFEGHGARGLLNLLQRYALLSIEANRDDQTPNADETLLGLLTDEIRSGNAPTAGEILDKARVAEPEVFNKWSAKGVASHLKRYGMITHKSHGRRVYGQVTLDELRRIQTAYGVDLGFNEEG